MEAETQPRRGVRNLDLCKTFVKPPSRHRFTRPYTPRTNGKAERFIQTALREWAYARHWTNSEERDQSLLPWQ